MKKRRFKLWATAGILLTLALAGCGNKQVENVDQASAKTQEDKVLTVYSAGPDGLAANIQQAFEEKTGIKVELFQGTTG
ncbi:MAG TPA: ABC transporter substrate-binding protein, partial [Lysinibacillus sp.]|nr:ABC transporter substrate-binding protein [Lysinibacillus sp.]